MAERDARSRLLADEAHMVTHFPTVPITLIVGVLVAISIVSMTILAGIG